MTTVSEWFVDINKDHWRVFKERNYVWAQCAETGEAMRIIGTPAEYGLAQDKTAYPFKGASK